MSSDLKMKVILDYESLLLTIPTTKRRGYISEIHNIEIQ